MIEARLIAEETSEIVKSVFVRLPDFNGCMRDGAAVRSVTRPYPPIVSPAQLSAMDCPSSKAGESWR